MCFHRTIQAFIGDYKFLSWHVSRDTNCELRSIKDSIPASGFGFVMNKKSAWTKYIDASILKRREGEQLIDIQKKWLGKVCKPTQFTSTKKQLGINHFGGIVILLAGTLVMCFPLLLPEYLYYKYFRNRISNVIRNGLRKNSIQKYEGIAQLPRNSIASPNILGLNMRRSNSVRKRSEFLNVYL